jgi:hypothetical protein
MESKNKTVLFINSRETHILKQFFSNDEISKLGQPYLISHDNPLIIGPGLKNSSERFMFEFNTENEIADFTKKSKICSCKLLIDKNDNNLLIIEKLPNNNKNSEIIINGVDTDYCDCVLESDSCVLKNPQSFGLFLGDEIFGALFRFIVK